MQKPSVRYFSFSEVLEWRREKDKTSVWFPPILFIYFFNRKGLTKLFKYSRENFCSSVLRLMYLLEAY